MKTRYLLFAAALVATAACQREVLPQNDIECKLVAEASASDGTRTVLDGKSVLWLQGDAIAVFADCEGTASRFATSQEGKNAVFTGKVPYGTVSVSAVYPWSDNLKYNSTSRIPLTLPDSQKAVSGSFDDDLAIMVSSAKLAEDGTAKLYFRQVCGLVKFSVAGEDVVSVSLESPSGCAVAGDAEIDPETASVSPRNSRNILSINSSESVLKAGDYYFTCFPFSAEDVKLVYHTTSSTKTRELGAVTVERAGIFSVEGSDADMLPDDWKPAGLEVKVAGQLLSETAEGSNIYEGDIEFSVASDFVVSIGDDEYGFASLSGAGGVGEVRNANCGLPYYNIASAATANADYHYTVSRAIGQMALKTDGGNDFFYSAKAGRVFVRIDNSGDKPIYYFEIRREADESLIFHEDFDLCTNGGDYMVAIAGTKGNAEDGVTPGTKGGVTANNPSFTFDYPEKITSNVPSDTYIRQRGLEGWTIEYAGERPGALQLCSSTIPGRLLSPKLSSLSAACDAVLSLDIARFSTSSVDPIYVRILGGGSIISAHVDTDAYAAAGKEAVSNDYSVGATEFAIVDDIYCPHSLANGDADKPHSRFSFQLSGIGPDSQIEISCPKGAKNAPRCFVFDIKIVKK